jgi:NADH dehydrogenase
MILVTGATGVVGTALLPLLLARGHQVRALVREPRRLGPQRVNVQIALVDLADPHGLRHAVRGCDTLIHLAAAIRDQPPRRVEEINGLGTLRLLRAAERAGAKRFLFFSALGATEFQRTRFFRSKALAEEAVLDADLDGTVFAPSIVYDRDDPWVTLLRRLALLPMLPVSGDGDALYQPIWAHDVARAVLGWVEGQDGSRRRYELAGPQVLSYDDMARTVAASAGRPRPLLHVPLPLVRSGLIWLRRLVGENVFATWEEAELMEIPMTTPRGVADAEALGVEPLAMREVLGGR